jgi:pimeloyl-ACP methyl ester carboxylesterase
MRKRAVAILLGLFFLLVTSSPEQACSAEESANKSHYEIVKIKTKTGAENSAAYFDGKSHKAVVFVPGAVFNKESWYFLSELLRKSNIASLSLDGKTPSDVLSAVNYLKDRDFKNIVLVGGSMGGGAILSALAKRIDESIDGVIVLAPAGGSPLKSKKIRKLFVVAKADRTGIYLNVKKSTASKLGWICENSYR